MFQRSGVDAVSIVRGTGRGKISEMNKKNEKDGGRPFAAREDVTFAFAEGGKFIFSNTQF